MINQVFQEQQKDSRKGDFVNLTSRDREELEIILSNEEIEVMSQWMWKKITNKQTKQAALKHLILENSTKEKTKDIIFNEIKMSEYLYYNQKTSTSKVIFSIRSKTLDIKTWNPWKYRNDLCVMCMKDSETMDHFVSCEEYEETISIDWRNILSENLEEQITIGKYVEKRHKRRQQIIDQQEAGQASEPGSTAPGIL